MNIQSTRQNPKFLTIFQKIDHIEQLLSFQSYQALAYNPNSGIFAQSSPEPVNEGEGDRD